MRKTSEAPQPGPGTHVTFRLFADANPNFFGSYPPPYRMGIVVELTPTGQIAFAEYDAWDVGITRVWVLRDVEEWQDTFST